MFVLIVQLQGRVFFLSVGENWFSITTIQDWLQNWRLFFIQLKVNSKPIVIQSHSFTRVSGLVSYM